MKKWMMAAVAAVMLLGAMAASGCGNGAIAFALPSLTNTLGDYLSAKGMKQLRIAETEKYAHVTFFFDGGVDKEIEGATRVLVNSPKVATYDLQPEMSAYEVSNMSIFFSFCNS